MTESEAIEVIKDILDECAESGEAVCYVTGVDVPALKMAINALEKQIPKKPIFDFNYSDTSSEFHCTCGKIIWVHHDIGTMDNNDAPNYCDNCGQKLDWDE